MKKHLQKAAGMVTEKYISLQTKFVISSGTTSVNPTLIRSTTTTFVISDKYIKCLQTKFLIVCVLCACVCVCVYVRVCVCVRACMLACMHADFCRLHTVL